MRVPGRHGVTCLTLQTVEPILSFAHPADAAFIAVKYAFGARVCVQLARRTEVLCEVNAALKARWADCLFAEARIAAHTLHQVSPCCTPARGALHFDGAARLCAARELFVMAAVAGEKLLAARRLDLAPPSVVAAAVTIWCHRPREPLRLRRGVVTCAALSSEQQHAQSAKDTHFGRKGHSKGHSAKCM